MRTTLAVEGLREARHRIDEVGERARRPEPPLASAATRLDLQMSERRRFSGGYRFRPASAEWVARKRREGLDPRTMHASNRLSSALENAESGTVRFNVFSGVLSWGLKTGSRTTTYAMVQAARGRRSVVIDRLSRRRISERVQYFIAYGFIG